ncbi:MAG: hypothetical protein K5681_10945 [Treponema sp.]|nr:hypothetical protein [Treponema sp.]
MKHLKRSIASLVIFCTIFISSYATGAGAQLGIFPAAIINQDICKADTFEVNATGTVRCSSIPLVFGLGLTFGSVASNEELGLSAFADWWIIDSQIKNTWNIYSGFGVSAGLKLDFNNSFYLTTGPRFFLGTNLLFLDHFIEVYAQQNLVPSLCMTMGSSDKLFRLYLPFEAGLRLHF